MGRAIEMENRQDDFERRLKLVEGALEELVQTKIHHVDLHESTKDILDDNPMTFTKKPDVKESPIGAGFAHKDTKSSKKKRKVKEKQESV